MNSKGEHTIPWTLRPPDPLSLADPDPVRTGAIAQSLDFVHFYTHICLMFSRYFLSSLESPSNGNEFYYREIQGVKPVSIK